jgi:hypothetical protein
MRYMVSGMIAGYAMAIVALGFGTWLLSRHRDAVTRAALRLPLAGVAGMLTVLPIIGLGALGAVFGLLLWAFEQQRPGAGLGSPNVLYSLFIVGISAAFLWLLVPLRRIWREVAALQIAFMAIFGWLLPWLAVKT